MYACIVTEITQEGTRRISRDSDATVLDFVNQG